MKNDNLTVICRISQKRLYKSECIKLITPSQKRGFYVSKKFYNLLTSQDLQDQTINDLLVFASNYYNSIVTVIKGDHLTTIASQDLLTRQAKAKANKKSFAPYGKPKATQGIYSALFAFELQNLKILLQLPKHYGANALAKIQALINTNKQLASNTLNYMLTIHLPRAKSKTLIIPPTQALAHHSQALAIAHHLDPYHSTPSTQKYLKS